MINLCLFGAGRIGSIHAANVSQHPDVQIKYIVDVNRTVANQMAEQYGATVTDVDTALEDTTVAGVIIASSTDTHADLMIRSARAGKTIFCEKPIDLNIDRVKECLQVIEDTQVACALGFNRRFDPQFNQLHNQLNQGKIGELQMVSITSRDPAPPPAHILPATGGLFRDMMIHDLDMARWLLNEEPTAVFASASCLIDPTIGELGDVDTAMVILKTTSGKLCQISNSRQAVYGYDQRIEVFGSKGMLQANNNTAINLSFSGEQGVISEKPLYFFLERYADAYKAELDNFIATIRGTEKPLANQHDGLQALALADAALESATTGKQVILN
ncbi:inositol 2-dehydrogenase [Endozoicomonas sp. SM1973]|uniref:Inositol 2-dehydrogenase n=1 Tax=Spartinivicinus marinus TaxID=2994442 RepID=A0A853IKE4_9GAMM|nr:inositol 2-dehydrogenase [Spartinivicinus marinus]MCX4025951.1 inositol 2-dehydrogenase [Spartinivicinus marinus]NYZ68136.1 inositol 2-dehydrogenase [Spartinivicinus marinus]